MNCQADDAVLDVFTAGGSYVFIAGAQHVVQPKGQELTFTKCLCCLLFLCEFLKGTEGGVGGGLLFRLYLLKRFLIIF